MNRQQLPEKPTAVPVIDGSRIQNILNLLRKHLECYEPTEYLTAAIAQLEKLNTACRYYRLNGTGDLELGQAMLLYDSKEDMLVSWKLQGRFHPDALSELHAEMENLGFDREGPIEQALWNLDAARKHHEQQTEAPEEA